MPPLFTRIYRFFLFSLMPKFVLFVIKSVPVTLEVYLHHSFGERYMWRLIGAFCVFYCYAVPSLDLVAPGARPLLSPFLIGLIVLPVIHFFHLPFRRYRGLVISSYSSGSPWSLWHRLFSLSPITTKRYVEPAFAMLVASIIEPFDYDLSSWLYISSVGLFIKCQIERLEDHNTLLDAFDGRIEARRQQGAVESYQAPRQQHRGFHEVRPHRRNNRRG